MKLRKDMSLEIMQHLLFKSPTVEQQYDGRANFRSGRNTRIL